MTPAQFTEWLSSPSRRPLVMGVLNVTPDSFSDGGLFQAVDAAVAHAEMMAAEGADIIDIGGESTRPGACRVPASEQIRRIEPVFRALAGRLPVVLSVDTTRAEVAAVALDHGAHIVNDISAGRDDARMLPLVAARGCAVILMHMKGQPADMQIQPHYDDVVGEVKAFLLERAAAARGAGVLPERILIDPGIGFGKRLEDNLLLLRELRQLAGTGHPVVVGTSRKSFIGHITGETEPAERVFGTAASVAWTVAAGAAIVRVHDVGPMAKVVRVVHAIQLGRPPGRDG